MIREGSSANACEYFTCSSKEILLRNLAKYKVKHANTHNCVEKALVEATPISGPANVCNILSASNAIELWVTLTIARVFCLFCLAYFNAAKVSAVSPDCDMNID